jgi:hypothetical protein
MPARIDTPLLFPTPAGRVWHESNFRRDVWIPALAGYLGIVCRRRVEVALRGALPGGDQGVSAGDQAARLPPSWITHLRAAGIDDADLAAVAGHTVETMIGTYTHPLGRSHDRIRKVIG